jgi:hypothetical protein
MKQVWEYKLEDQFVSNFYFNSDDYPSIFKNTLKVALPKPPVRNILKVKIDGNEIDPQQCSLDTLDNKFCLCIHSRNFFTKKTKLFIDVMYEAGISDCAENIPYQLKLANLMLVANAFRERYSYSQGNIISQGIKQLLSPFLNIRML